ncbi:hypothetical protein AGRA3207_004344 [Actinomadura graeca]|uniref:Uncharacterized protein n=1 Tax=Actinomadura graeca TaxID=2750812 RepID=A0ABX8QWI0_9ACTN|nr:hypothetical protein [Actinomadura graeca]QXJ23215.1 hypothetical protein AGRA3207_004344 [Actinomadura graeca]
MQEVEHPVHKVLLAADMWKVQCEETRQVKVKIDYVTGRTVTSEANVEAGTEWEALDFSQDTSGRGTSGYISFYENGEFVYGENLNWN